MLAYRTILFGMFSWLLILPLVSNAQEENATTFSSSFPFPETGAWFEPGNPGTGFFWEIQNGILAGAQFGFDNQGDNAWLLFSGPLMESEQSSVLWEIEADLTQSSGGECIVNCTGESSNANIQRETIGTIRIEILGRNLAMFSVDGGQQRIISPLVFGISGFIEFPQTSDMLFPVLTGKWLLSLAEINLDTGESNFPDGFQAATIDIGQRSIEGAGDAREIWYPVSLLVDGEVSQTTISCSLFPEGGNGLAPLCEFPVPNLSNSIRTLEPVFISDSRMTLVGSPEGDPPASIRRLELFRIGYD